MQDIFVNSTPSRLAFPAATAKQDPSCPLTVPQALTALPLVPPIVALALVAALAFIVPMRLPGPLLVNQVHTAPQVLQLKAPAQPEATVPHRMWPFHAQPAAIVLPLLSPQSLAHPDPTVVHNHPAQLHATLATFVRIPL
jgi:hypothetical protein